MRYISCLCPYLRIREFYNPSRHLPRKYCSKRCVVSVPGVPRRQTNMHRVAGGNTTVDEIVATCSLVHYNSSNRMV